MYDLHDIVEMKKPHPCGENRWEIIRMGMDIKILLKTVAVVLKKDGSM